MEQLPSAAVSWAMSGGGRREGKSDEGGMIKGSAWVRGCAE